MKNEFNVGVDLFMTVTMNELCDILLPAACYPERDGIRVGDGVQHGETINKAVDGGDVKSDMEINLEMGRRFNPEAWPWETVQEMYSYILKPDTGLTFEELQDQAPVYLPYEYYKYKTGKLRPDGQVGFNTPTGRIELWSVFYHNMGLDPMPKFVEPEPSPYSTPKIAEELPLVLITGCRSIETFHSENRRQDHLRAIKPEPLLEIHRIIFMPPFSNIVSDERYHFLTIDDPYEVEIGFIYDRNSLDFDSLRPLLGLLVSSFVPYETAGKCVIAFNS